MRAKRILYLAAGAAAAALLAALGAAFIPAVQTRLARHALLSAAPRRITLDRLSAGPRSVALEGLRVETAGSVLVVPRVDAEMGVLSAALGRGYRIRTLVAKGWTLDLAPPAPGAAASGPAAGEAGAAWASRVAGALLAAFNVPAGVSVDAVDLEGVVVLPDEAGRRVGKARVVLTGGGLGAGRRGTFQCTVAAAVDAPAAPVSSVAVSAALDATMDLSGTLTRAELKADATATGPQFPGGIGLSCAAVASRGPGKTSYSLALQRGPERVATLYADSPDGSRRLAGAWTLDLRDTDLAPFALGRRLPVFHLAGGGNYDLDAASGDVHAQGEMEASADRLGLVAPALARLGRIELSADFDVARAGDSLRVDRLVTSVSGAAPVASLRALQPFEFSAASGELKVAQPSGDLVGITVTALPLSWLGALFPHVAFAGSRASGEFVMRAENGRLALRTKAPLAATGVSVTEGGRRWASDLEVSAFLLADYSLQGWQVQFAPLAARSDGIRVLSVEARVGRLAGRGEALKAAGSWSASLPGLARQPGAAGLPRLASGEASGSFEASLDAVRELRVKVAVSALALGAGAPGELPSITSDARADLYPDGHAKFSLPLKLDYGARAVQMVLSGTLSRQAGGQVFDATLSAETITLRDLAVLTALAGRGGAGSPDPAAAPGPSPAPAAPFWPPVRGRLAFLLQDFEVPWAGLHNARGTLRVEPLALHMDSGMAAVGDGGAVRLDGDLAFSPGADRPYALRAAVSADNLDSAPLFRALEPEKAPIVEGRFDVAGHAAGAGAGFGDLVEALQGDATFASKDGRFRALRTDLSDVARQAPSRIADALDSVTSLFGKKSDRIGEALVASVGGLSEIHYDQMNVTVRRGDDLDLVLTEIAVIAPEERVTGSGRITHVDGVPVRAQPLALDLDLGVQGNLAKMMGVVGLLADGHDELGYTHLYERIHLGGTLQSLDRSQLRELLVQAPVRKGSGLIDKLLGR